MNATTEKNEIQQDADTNTSGSLEKLAAKAFDQLTAGLDSMHHLKAVVNDSPFDKETWGRVDRAIKLAQAAAENLEPLATEATPARPTKPR